MAFLMALALAGLVAAARAPDGAPLVTLLGETVTAAALPEARPLRATRVADFLRGRMMRDFVLRNGLVATPDEVAELVRYDAEFERRDRAQRARKFAELDRRLASGGLGVAERAHLEDFRATLSRLAAYEAEEDRKPAAERAESVPDYAPWIEMWKMHRVLYDRRGGVVGLASFGPYPHGAWASLVAEYERRGALRFHDQELRQDVIALFNRPPRIPVAPAEVDFTPYWRKPIPSSYFPGTSSPVAAPAAR